MGFPELTIIAEKKYDKHYEYLKDMYEYAGSKLGVTLDEVLLDFDRFVQAILFIVAESDSKLDTLEVTFIKEVVYNDILFKDYSVADLCGLTGNALKNLLDKCNEIIKIVPHFVKLSVLYDKKIDEELRVISPTCCQINYDFIKRLPNYIKFIDGEVAPIEDIAANDLLSEVKKYYKKRYMKYSVERGKDDE